MSKFNERPLEPSQFTDDQRISYSQKFNPKPWRVAYIKEPHHAARVVILDAAGNIVKGRSALVRICRLVNTTEG